MTRATSSILFRSALAYLVITVLNITVFVLLVFENQIDLISQNAVLSSLNAGTAIKYSLDAFAADRKPLDAVALQSIEDIAMKAGVLRTTVFGEDGKVLFRSGPAPAAEAAAASTATPDEFAAINAAILKRDFESKLFSHSIDMRGRTVELYIPFMFAGDRVAVAEVTMPMRDIARQMAYLYRQCAIIALLILALHSGFVLIVTRVLVRPLRGLLSATEKMSQGILEVRVPVMRDDEIGQLARAFNEMSVALQRMRQEARESNPLTGLPGNLSIARHIDERLQSGAAIAVLYCDLDNFKAYNDAYGFSKGDEAILYTRDSLKKTIDELGITDGFIGHEGGDDFIAVIPFDAWEPCVNRFLGIFDAGVPMLYSETDRANGFLESVDRKGRRQRFPLMTMSVAVVTNQWRAYSRHEEIAGTAAELKKIAKKTDGTPGSRFAIDRRKDTGEAMTTSVVPAKEG
jgi:GGDEF domain-containing protein